jgi:hypothetical protein
MKATRCFEAWSEDEEIAGKWYTPFRLHSHRNNFVEFPQTKEKSFFISKRTDFLSNGRKMFVVSKFKSRARAENV